MPRYSKNEVVLVHYPFSNLSGSKVRPAIVVNTSHISQDNYLENCPMLMLEAWKTRCVIGWG
jgi:hypothetical protein